MPPAIAAFAASKATSALYVSDKQNVNQHKQNEKKLLTMVVTNVKHINYVQGCQDLDLDLEILKFCDLKILRS